MVPVTLDLIALYGLSSSLELALTDGTTGAIRPVRESEVLSPSAMIAIGDSEIPAVRGLPAGAILGHIMAPFLQVNLLLSEQFAHMPGIPPPPSLLLFPTDKAMLGRHGGRWNMLFCDGHSQNGKLGQFFNFTDDNVLRLWNRDNQPHRTRQPR